MASGEGSKQDHVVVKEFPAPPGWTKKLVQKKPSTPKKTGTPPKSPSTPKKTGTPPISPSTPKKTGTPPKSPSTFILWISPTGEEIRTVTQLTQYLKSHPGGPDITEFNWSSTGYSPRRSLRISEKQKAVELPTRESPKKRRKSLLGPKAKSDADEEDKTTDEKDANAEETKAEEDKGTDEEDKGTDEEDKTTDEKDANAEETKAEEDKGTDEKDDNAEETKETVGSSTTDAQDSGEANTADAGGDAGDGKAKKKQKGKKAGNKKAKRGS